ncbi:MAG: glutamyl-tRNA(Gln) amidotransferase subunit A [Planctomycetaceae bacterium]|nr:MAG: glutamyl-tRNA(Gln) amidotransferase subunit A [Planctomycetaceae bacterium]
MSWTSLSTQQLVQALRAGTLRSEDVTRECLDRIEQYNPTIQAVVSYDAEQVLECARHIDRKRARGEPLGALAGLPVGLKDVISQRGAPCTCASRMLESYRAPYDAHVVEKLRAADAVLLCRLNCDEFAMGSTGETSAFGVTRNPWDLERTPGGSSSGSGAAVAARMVPMALGSDTGGSVRLPATYCGVVGLKPTYGRVSRYGLVAYASSLDQIGPMARDVWGTALLLEVIAGPDSRDSTCLNQPAKSYSQLSCPVDLHGVRVGWIREFETEGLDPEVQEALHRVKELLQRGGAEVQPVSLPTSPYAVATYYIIACSEASSNLSRYDGIHYGYRTSHAADLYDLYACSRGQAFGVEVKRRIMLGAYALSTGYYDQYYVKALKVRRLIRQDYDRVLKTVDVLLAPVSPSLACKLQDSWPDPLTMYLGDIYTIGANLAGLPALALPVGWSRAGLPLGVQLIAPALEEERLLKYGLWLEKNLEPIWNKLPPAEHPPMST